MLGAVFANMVRAMGREMLTIPFDQLVNVVTLTQALIFAAFFVTRARRASISVGFLTAAFLIMAAIKADQLYQMLGGFQHYPQYGFALAPIQAAMTPALYLFVIARTTPEFSLRRGHLLHLTPVLLITVYLFAIYYRLDTDAKAALIASDGLNTGLNRLIAPLIGDAIQLGYIVAAYRRLETFGLNLKNWFARVEDRNLLWLKHLLTVWGCIFTLHAAMTILAGVVDTRPAARVVFVFLDGFHLLFVNLLALLGAADLERRLSAKETLPPATPARYEGSGLTATDRAAIFQRAQAALSDSALYLKPDLTLRDLADAAGAAPREISEAINGAGDQSFYDLVNAARVRHAQTLLVASPEARILDIAFQSGFNSKSAFNDAFKKTARMTPSEYRRRHGSSGETVPPNAKTTSAPS